VKVGDYDALILLGGVMSPDKLRVNDKALAIVKAFVETGKVVAAICHAPWLLVETGAIKDRNVTSYVSIRTDVVNAGGRWVDQQVVTANGIITSRLPGDIDALPRSSRKSRRGRTAAPPDNFARICLRRHESAAKSSLMRPPR
jgi:protease I